LVEADKDVPTDKKVGVYKDLIKAFIARTLTTLATPPPTARVDPLETVATPAPAPIPVPPTPAPMSLPPAQPEQPDDITAILLRKLEPHIARLLADALGNLTVRLPLAQPGGQVVYLEGQLEFKPANIVRMG
jgi:hypothetical protein